PRPGRRLDSAGLQRARHAAAGRRGGGERGRAQRGEEGRPRAEGERKASRASEAREARGSAIGGSGSEAAARRGLLSAAAGLVEKGPGRGGRRKEEEEEEEEEAAEEEDEKREKKRRRRNGNLSDRPRGAARETPRHGGEKSSCMRVETRVVVNSSRGHLTPKSVRWAQITLCRIAGYPHRRVSSSPSLDACPDIVALA
ncbi:unnamed protein product, partial [Prorocentrum cordatum]